MKNYKIKRNSFYGSRKIIPTAQSVNDRTVFASYKEARLAVMDAQEKEERYLYLEGC
jgi:hypothetical protein